MEGKSDHITLKRAKERNAIKAGFCTKKSPHLKDRDTRITIASRISAEKMVRSRGFPSSSAWATRTACPPSHCEGSRDPTMNIQMRGTHKAGEVSGSRAGSKQRSPRRSTTQSSSAMEG